MTNQEIKLEAKDLNREAKDAVMDLVRYLYSSKFWDDKTVQVQDVLNRLNPVIGALNEQSHVLNNERQ